MVSTADSRVEATVRRAAPFIQSLYDLLLSPPGVSFCEDTDSLLSWSQSGEQVVFHDSERFASEICPKLFRHNKWASFTRLLNMYGFRKIPSGFPTSMYGPSDTIVFMHDNFLRGRMDLLYTITRKKSQKESVNKPPADQTREAKRQKRASTPDGPAADGAASLASLCAAAACAEVQAQPECIRRPEPLAGSKPGLLKPGQNLPQLEQALAPLRPHRPAPPWLTRPSCPPPIDSSPLPAMIVDVTETDELPLWSLVALLKHEMGPHLEGADTYEAILKQAAERAGLRYTVVPELKALALWLCRRFGLPTSKHHVSARDSAITRTMTPRGPRTPPAYQHRLYLSARPQ